MIAERQSVQRMVRAMVTDLAAVWTASQERSLLDAKPSLSGPVCGSELGKCWALGLNHQPDRWKGGRIWILFAGLVLVMAVLSTHRYCLNKIFFLVYFVFKWSVYHGFDGNFGSLKTYALGGKVADAPGCLFSGVYTIIMPTTVRILSISARPVPVWKCNTSVYRTTASHSRHCWWCSLSRSIFRPLSAKLGGVCRLNSSAIICTWRIP